jgi:hypothetical protein
LQPPFTYLFHLQYSIVFLSGEGQDLRLNVETLYGATHIHVNNVECNAWNVDLQPIFEGIFWVLSLVPREQQPGTQYHQH